MPQGVKHVPTDATKAIVRTLATIGWKHSAIAKYIDISGKTLTKHYKPIMDQVTIMRHFNVANVIYEAAVHDRNLSACFFWMKTQAGWRETGDYAPDVEDTDTKVDRIEIEVLPSKEEPKE